MAHHAISIVYGGDARPIDKKRVKAAVVKDGGLIVNSGPSAPRASKYSQMRGVERVVVTIVHETHHATWRKGKLS